MRLVLFGIAICTSLSLMGMPAAGYGAGGDDGWVLMQEQRPLMGTLFTVQVHHEAEDEAEQSARRAMEQAFARAAEIEQAASDYREDSELTRINSAPAGQRLELGEDLRCLLRQSLRFAELSEGAFDPTVGRLSLLWRRARRSVFEPPSPERLQEALQASGWRHLRLVDDGEALVIEREGLRLDLGGIGKGFAADEMLRVLAKSGFGIAAVAAAGDIRLGDAPPGESGWSVELAPLGRSAGGAAAVRYKVIGRAGQATEFESAVRLSGRAVSTSGDRHQFMEYEGRRYSHIIDPRTGRGLTHEQAVIVVAPTATEADALATALNVLGPEIPEGLRAYLEQRSCQVWWFEPETPGDESRE